MPRAAPLLSAFNAGELSPHMDGRAEVAKYGNGCKLLENFIPMIQGPAKRRAGTRFVSEVKDSTSRTWLVRFEFNTANAYQLEFGNNYIRFFTNHGRVVVSGVAAWVTATAYAVGDLRSNGGVNYYCTTAHTSGTFATDLAAGKWYALTGNIYEIPTPWSTADLTNADGTFSLRFVESNDIVYICHKNYPPRKLSRYSGTNWQLSIITPKKGPFKTVNTTATTVYASAATGSVTLTASSSIFDVSMVGSLFYLEQMSVLAINMWQSGTAFSAGDLARSAGVNYKTTAGGTSGGVKPIHTEGTVNDGSPGVAWAYQDPGYGYGIITGFTSPTQVTLQVIDQIPFYAVGSGNATTKWALGAWNNTDGWPTQVSFYKERLVFGRGQNVWLSVSGDYETFSARDASGNVVADMAISLILQSDKVNDLEWFASTDALLCGTAGGEFAVQSITTNLPFGPDNVTAPSISAFGSRNCIPVRVAEAIVFVQRSGIKMRDIIYDYLSNKFQSTDQSVMADHITQGGLNQIAFQQEPYSLIWAVRADGALICMTYSREQYDNPPFGGWHRHPIGGSFNGGPAVVESVSLIPAPAGDRDELWIIVKRTINGVTKRYVEYMEYERRFNDDPQDAFYLDSGLTLNNTVAATLTLGSGALTQYSTGVLFTAGSSVFSIGDVGREIHYRYSTLGDDGRTLTWYTAKALITDFTSGTQVLCTINFAFPSLSTIAASGWRMTVTTVSGLSHLEGQTVQILGDGANIPDAVVSGGSITVQSPISKAQVGLKQRARLQSMRLSAGAGDGTSQGKTARINKCTVRLFETLGVKFGPSFDSLDEIDFRNVSDLMDGPPSLYTGDQLVDFAGDYSTDPWVCIQQDYPLPCTVVGIMPIVSAYDRS